MGLAERADLIVDFTNVPIGNYVLGNLGPDEPFGGGGSGRRLPGRRPRRPPARCCSSGSCLRWRPTRRRRHGSWCCRPSARLAGGTARPLALIEKSGVGFDADGNEVEGPVEALLGTVADGMWIERKWMDPVTENPAVGATEVWEFYNTTADAHPMHVHEVAFQVVNREGLVLDDDGEVVQPIQLDGTITPPEPWEDGWKDTVIAYPGQVTRLRLRFTNPGQFVWHCHIVEHEDNEMMRPLPHRTFAARPTRVAPGLRGITHSRSGRPPMPAGDPVVRVGPKVTKGGAT